MTQNEVALPVVVFDFDGTITERDIGDEICDHFAPPAWREIDNAWLRKEISLPEAQRQMWALARATRTDAIEYSRKVGQRRAGLLPLLSALGRVGTPIWLASGGFDFYIEALLGADLAYFERLYFNTTHFVDGRIEVEFPHRELACDLCAVCKGKVCDLARHTGRSAFFIGDGASDRCVVGRADEVFAVRDSKLDVYLSELGAPFHRFRTFKDLLPLVERAMHVNSNRM